MASEVQENLPWPDARPRRQAASYMLPSVHRNLPALLGSSCSAYVASPSASASSSSPVPSESLSPSVLVSLSSPSSWWYW